MIPEYKQQAQDAQDAQDAKNLELKKSLHKFASSGDVEAITALFEANPELDINIVSKGKNIALHSALSHNQQGLIIDYLISQGADIHAFNTKGYNPVILAIIHCQRNGCQALQKLINAGADCTSKFGRCRFSGMSPLDLAIQCNNKAAATLIERIRLEKKTTIDEKEVNSAQEIPAAKKNNHGTCPLCQCSVKFPTKMSFILNDQGHAEKKERERSITQLCEVIQSNPHEPTKEHYTSRKYLDQFLSHAGGNAFEKLCKIEYHGIGNKNKLRKELSESYSILHAVQQCCDDLGKTSERIETDPPIHLEQVFLIDLCSGKSLTTALCGALFPSEPCDPGYGNNHFLAVDRLPTHLIPHFLQDANASYLSRDIMIPEFFTELEKEVHRQAAEGRTAILVGMHLCGNLSERAIEVFQRIPLIKALILSPCCLPKLRRGIPFDSFQRHEEEDLYVTWSRYLEEKMDENSQHTNLTVQRYFDKEVHSIKNAIITGVKR